MKITLKDLLDCEGVQSIDVDNSGSMCHIMCPKCLFPVEAGILVVAWDPPQKKYCVQIWCRHCVKESA